FAYVDGQIELELVAGTRRRIWSDGVIAVVEVELGFRSRQDAGCAVEKPRKLGERDWSLVIKAARRMTLPQELRDRRDHPRRRGRQPAQIDFPPGPARPQRRQRRNDVGVRINSAQRVGVPASSAARVEQKIVKVPQDEIVVTFGRSNATFATN